MCKRIVSWNLLNAQKYILFYSSLMLYLKVSDDESNDDSRTHKMAEVGGNREFLYVHVNFVM